MKNTTSVTALELLAQVMDCRPGIDGQELEFDSDPSADQERFLSVLHTGIRAAITKQQWWGSTVSDAKRPVVAVLRLDEPIPEWCGLLCVAGDTSWDRVLPAARIDSPMLFASVN